MVRPCISMSFPHIHTLHYIAWVLKTEKKILLLNFTAKHKSSSSNNEEQEEFYELWKKNDERSNSFETERLLWRLFIVEIAFFSGCYKKRKTAEKFLVKQIFFLLLCTFFFAYQTSVLKAIRNKHWNFFFYSFYICNNPFWSEAKLSCRKIVCETKEI